MNQIKNKIIMKELHSNIPFSLISLLGFFLLFKSCEKEVPEEKIFVNIEATKLPDKTSFQLGETPKVTGIEVSEIYTDGTKRPTTKFNISWSADIFKRCSTLATVTARERSVTFEILFDGDLIDTGLPVVYMIFFSILTKKQYSSRNRRNSILRDGIL